MEDKFYLNNCGEDDVLSFDSFYLNNCGEDDVLSFNSGMFKVDKLREEVNGLDEHFKLLNSNEVVTVDSYYQTVISHSTFRVGEFTEALLQDLRSFVTEDYAGKQEQELQKGWFEEGTDCEILRLGAKGWQKGKVKIRVSLEFCPNELAVEEIPASNEPEISSPESPLDDIRRMMNENS